jgi:hypothetical protein
MSLGLASCDVADVADSAGDKAAADKQTISAWFDSLAIDQPWAPPKAADILQVEATRAFSKFRVYDPRAGHPSYAYIIVKDGKVEGIWEQ